MRRSEHPYVNRGSIRQRSVCRNMLSPSSCVCWRARASSSQGLGNGCSAMGDHMGCFDHVLYLVRLIFPHRPFGFPATLGSSNDPRDFPLHRVIVHPRVSTMVGKERSLGGMLSHYLFYPCQQQPRRELYPDGDPTAQGCL